MNSRVREDSCFRGNRLGQARLPRLRPAVRTIRSYPFRFARPGRIRVERGTRSTLPAELPCSRRPNAEPDRARPTDYGRPVVPERRRIARGPRFPRGGDGGHGVDPPGARRADRPRAGHRARRPLPENSGAALTGSQDEGAEQFPSEEFVERVREQRADLSADGARLHVRAVLESLAEAIDGDVWHDVRTNS